MTTAGVGGCAPREIIKSHNSACKLVGTNVMQAPRNLLWGWEKLSFNKTCVKLCQAQSVYVSHWVWQRLSSKSLWIILNINRQGDLTDITVIKGYHQFVSLWIKRKILMWREDINRPPRPWCRKSLCYHPSEVKFAVQSHFLVPYLKELTSWILFWRG